MKRAGAFVLLLYAGAVLAAKNPVQSCPVFPVPDKAKLQAVAQQLDFNGVPMTIQRLETTAPPSALLAFYRANWAAAAGARGPVEYALGPWQVIATLRGDCFYTVQYRPFGTGGTEALLGISAPPGDAPTAKEEVPMLPGSAMVNDLSHNDGGKTARTVLIKNGFSTTANTDFYRRNLADLGWRVTGHYRKKNGGDVLILRNGVRELSLAATADGGGSSVLLNYVDQP